MCHAKNPIGQTSKRRERLGQGIRRKNNLALNGQCLSTCAVENFPLAPAPPESIKVPSQHNKKAKSRTGNLSLRVSRLS